MIANFILGIADRFSRKYGLLTSGLLLIVGSGLLSASFYLWYDYNYALTNAVIIINCRMILIGRLLSGVASG